MKVEHLIHTISTVANVTVFLKPHFDHG